MNAAGSTDTIAAIATPPGIGALGIIRISGREAIEVANKLFPKKDLLEARPHTLHYGPLKFQEELIDEVLLSLFRAPASYTGENLIEISCHGSPYIVQRIMEVLIALGIRPAGPGEFTMRAFMNGKLDLSQAEAVADLISSETRAAHDTALLQMRGGFSKKIKDLRQQLLQLASLVELELDFAEEDVEFANRETLQLLLNEINAEVENLAQSFRLGNAIKSGVKVVIAGRPNAGKSTLLNSLLQEERAIVSDIPGTTRDVIEDTIVIEGIQFRFIDTAGIRSTTDALESIGIERTLSKLREAHVILYLFDVNEISAEELSADLASLPQDKTILAIGNKIDRTSEDYVAVFPQADVFISAREEHRLDDLRQKLISSLDLPERRTGDVVVTNIRHYHVLQNILRSIEAIRTALRNHLPTDLVAIDIRMALHDMGEITGEITTDEILGTIFSQFCIGK